MAAAARRHHVLWQVQSRNKKSVALDLRDEPPREIVRGLVARPTCWSRNFSPV